ncbi:MAG: hypothetical protein AMXMBFR47_28280 [Planctomycetota bacterium]
MNEVRAAAHKRRAAPREGFTALREARAALRKGFTVPRDDRTGLNTDRAGL